MTTNSDIQKVLDLFGDAVYVEPGQVPRNNGVQLYEKEYIGQGATQDEAIQGALDAFRREHRGERVYTRGVSFSQTGLGFLAVIVAAIRTAPLDFSDALRALINNKKIMRTGWNGVGMHVEFAVGGARVQPYFIMKKGNGDIQPGWVPSIGDLMATDWEIV